MLLDNKVIIMKLNIYWEKCRTCQNSKCILYFGTQIALRKKNVGDYLWPSSSYALQSICLDSATWFYELGIMMEEVQVRAISWPTGSHVTGTTLVTGLPPRPVWLSNPSYITRRHHHNIVAICFFHFYFREYWMRNRYLNYLHPKNRSIKQIICESRSCFKFGLSVLVPAYAVALCHVIQPEAWNATIFVLG